MALLERSQCDRIDTMIGVATRTVNNQAIADQLKEVVHHLEEGFTLAEAFDTATHLDDQARQFELHDCSQRPPSRMEYRKGSPESPHDS